MKKIMIFVLLPILLISCEMYAKQGDIIRKIENEYRSPCPGYTRYETKNGILYAPAGVYNIGDTVKFCK